MTHKLKTWPKEFWVVYGGQKKYEIRNDDRNFQAGDQLMLEEYNPDTKEYSGNFILCDVPFLTKGGSWGLPDHLCVMSISIVHIALPDNCYTGD